MFVISHLHNAASLDRDIGGALVFKLRRTNRRWIFHGWPVALQTGQHIKAASCFFLFFLLDFLSYSRTAADYLASYSLEGENPWLRFLFFFLLIQVWVLIFAFAAGGVCSLKRPADVAELIKQIGRRTRPQSLWIMEEVARLQAPLYQIWNALLTRCVIYFNQIIFYETRRSLNLSKRERWRFWWGGRRGGDCILKLDVTARDHDLILHAWLYNEATANGQLWLTLGRAGVSL